MDSTTLVRLYVTAQHGLAFEASLWLLVPLVLAGGAFGIRWLRRRPRLDVVRLTLDFGGIGTLELKPTVEDIQIAHRIWTELVTRKAAVTIDPDHDIIGEVYDSWYALFGRIRALIADIPADQLRRHASTQQLVHLAIASLNEGLRPHLTKWQARYRNWYANQGELLKTMSPEEVQRRFPGYAELVADVRQVNAQLIQYANELHKVIHGR